MRTLGIVRRLVGCFYCGYPCPGDVCGYCSDLPLKDPLVHRARQPLSEQELFAAAGSSRLVAGDDHGASAGSRTRQSPTTQERMKAAG